MGLASWIRDLGVPSRIAIGILGSCAAFSTVYGLYTLYFRHVDRLKSQEFSKDNGATEQSSEKRVLVLGLDGAGKSTFLSALAQEPVGTIHKREATRPTEGFSVICVTTDGVSLNIWEIGGAEKFRTYWPNFLRDANVIVYVVDSCATERFQDSKNALLKVLSDKRLDGVPLVLLACKQDLSNAKSAAEIASFFELERLASTGNRQTEVAGFEILSNGQVKGLQEAKQLILNFCK